MFNHPSYIDEFRNLVASLSGINTALEVGAYSGELMIALKGLGIRTTGISLDSVCPDVIVGDFLQYEFDTKYDLVFSSGVLEHYDIANIRRFLKKMKNLSNQWVLNIVPNSRCSSYIQAKKTGREIWSDEKDFTMDELLKLHLELGQGEYIVGEIGLEWAKVFNPEENTPYLVYVAIRYLK